MNFQQVRSASWTVEKMADGSVAVFDRQSTTAYFLNSTAAAAWEASSQPAGIEEIARRMSATLRTQVSQETALAALADLEEKRLVESSDSAMLASRRSALQRIGIAAGAAVPVVLALTTSEQKALAFQQRSGGVGVVSDIRLKEDIRLVAHLFGLNVYTFRFSGSSIPRIGLIAQEVYERFPDAVIPGEPWKIDYAKLVHLLGDPQAYVLGELAVANS